MKSCKLKTGFKKILFGMGIASAVLIFNSMNVMAAPEDEVAEEVPVETYKPTLNAAVSDGGLTVNAVSDYGIRAIFINGYEFKNTGNGNLKIKLQQFDSSYRTFYIYAEDNEGNTSDVYEVPNPYFDEDPTDDKDPSVELPIDATPTDPTTAQGVLNEHLSSGGREFYEIETINGKVFYLIVDMLGDEEKVYFLTEISERDLLNATSDTSDTLPRNSAIPEDNIPDNGQAVANNNADASTIEKVFGIKKSNETNTEVTKKEKENEKGEEEMGTVINTPSGSTIIYVVMGVVCVAVILIVSASKKKKRGKKDSLDSNEEANEENEE